jgi:hypothetical protein
MRAMTTSSVIFRKNQTVGATAYTQGQIVSLTDDDTLRGLLVSGTVAYCRGTLAPQGSPSHTKGVRKGGIPVTVDLASIAAGATLDTVVTVTGAALGNGVVVNPPANLPAGLLWAAWVTAADKVTVRVKNETGAAVDAASGTWNFWLAR